MPPKLRPTGLGSGIYKDRPDYTVSTGEWEVGRIYRRAAVPGALEGVGGLGGGALTPRNASRTTC